MTPPLLPPVPAPFQLNATVVSVHDGDTFDVRVRWSKRRYDEPQPIRLLGCNALELKTPGGDAAAVNLQALLPPGTPVVLLANEDDKFAPRWDCSVVYAVRGVSRDLVADLVVDGWVAPWNGTGPRPLPPWPRPATEPRLQRAARVTRLEALDRAVRDWRGAA